MPSGIYKRKKNWTNQTSFKKGSIPWNKGVKGLLTGKESHHWKGNNVVYTTYHHRVVVARGKPDKCTQKNCSGITQFYEWANLTGKYEDINDYKKMCRSCHRKYDFKRRKNNG